MLEIWDIRFRARHDSEAFPGAGLKAEPRFYGLFNWIAVSRIRYRKQNVIGIV